MNIQICITVSYILLGYISEFFVWALQCPHPAIPQYSKVTLSQEARLPGASATYSCDEGYELFGEPSRVCMPDGSWNGNLPYCAVNVAYGKPANQSSTTRGGSAQNANDGDTTTVHENKFCSETRKENSPWWQVDLLQEYEIRVVRIFTRGCCDQQPLHDLEIRIGNSSIVQGNRLCAWYPRNIEDGTAKDFECAYPIIGRYVYIQMVGIEGSLSLCEVLVFTTQELSPERCANQLEPLKLTTFNQTCYEFQGEKGGTFKDADRYCQERGGLIAHSMSNITHNFLSSELERLKSNLKSKLVWLGAQRESDTLSQQWNWVNNQTVESFLWAPDQPNNYNNQQNCVVLDGGRKWLWNDVTCDLDFLPWICQYGPSNCGTPDRKENATVLEENFMVGQKVTYACPTGNMLVGNKTRTCASDGFWTGSAPSCKYVDCGSLSSIEHGKVEYPEARTNFNATAHYVCDQNYTLVGEKVRTCSSDGIWDGEEAKCLFNQCPELEAPPNGFLEVTGQTAGSQAKYSCEKSYKLVGNQVRKCELGGKWTDSAPQCKFIDCGKPEPVAHGNFDLINKTTTYLSKIKYSCHMNFSLVGDEERTCLDTKLWSGQNPMCKLIDCGEPDIKPGSYVEGDGFTVHSVIKYFCEPGHLMISKTLHRTCGLDGKWSGEAVMCRFIDCGRVPLIPRGAVRYANETTYFQSVIFYECSFGYRLIGNKVRLCLEEGHWSENAPVCEEIRCPIPEVPQNASVMYSGNDRSSAVSFKVGSNAQYRCHEGHILTGVPLRRCLQTGVWSGEVPFCEYVDCGFPLPVPHGHWLLPNNATFYTSSVEYKCDENYRIIGPNNRRCLDNGTWSGKNPKCIEISCGSPDKLDSMTVIKGDIFTVGRIVAYSCIEGYKVVGQSVRSCLKSGQWSEQTPFCQLVDCGHPTIVPNGDGFLMNGTTTYESVVEYKCSPEYRMVGHPLRHCLASGSWSGQEPKCILVDCGQPRVITNGQGHLMNGTTIFQAMVKYTCLRGYRIVGNPVRQCLSSGNWSGEEPMCIVVDCGQPAVITNGLRYLMNGTTIFQAMVEYTCLTGYRIVGDPVIECLSSGNWSGEKPMCSMVDCGQPAVITNGQGQLMNGTTVFQAMVEYTCLPEFIIVGDPVRQCLSSGNWSGEEPMCLVSDSQTSDYDTSRSKTIGIGVAVGIGIVLVLIIIVVCIKLKKGRLIKNSKNVPVHRTQGKQASVLSYSNFSMETDGRGDPDNLSESGAIRHNPNGLVTFSANPQPIYANVTVNGQRLPG
ncbi:sushi, von Willebrand factor type A, EGF and pentraxin domain-containing protein 1-like isoform X3 [Tachypleus tridentatus]|uniref:sushi, von Willebrand factor type A, EGF and pentraxin domain-containing protein 1-like isoform X3 n=1 Tax=Tachypleus tridentatus TaxID=6853 RepID=UPI003FD197C2